MEQKGSPLGSPENVAATSRAVQAMFARIAPRYDFLNHFLSAGFDLRWRRAAAEAVSKWLERPESVAADLCCGTGDLTFALARLSPGLVVGADFCGPMISLAGTKRARGAKRDSARARFIEADTLSLPFGDNALDLVSIAFGFRNLADYDRGLGEIHRVLRPGGVIAILEFSRMRWPVVGAVFRFYFRRILPRLGTLVSGVPGPYQYLPDSVRHFPDQESLARKLQEAGFHDVRYRNFLGGAAALHLGTKLEFRS